jgi:hypothetical protein
MSAVPRTVAQLRRVDAIKTKLPAIYHKFRNASRVNIGACRVPQNAVVFRGLLQWINLSRRWHFLTQFLRFRQSCATFPRLRAAHAAARIVHFVALSLLLSTGFNACMHRGSMIALESFGAADAFAERTRVLLLEPGVTVTVVAPAVLTRDKPVELILYALPNGNTTAQTIGKQMADGVDWHFDIQHIGAQTRALRARGVDQAVVAYLEANTRSWPEWRRVHGYDVANKRIVAIVDEIRSAIGNPEQLRVTLTGHSGGGSFAWGFIDGQDSLPPWLSRIGFLDSNYSYETRHGHRIAQWLAGDTTRTLVVLAYDDREIMLDGKKVVNDSGGTWRASHRMMESLRTLAPFSRDSLTRDTLGAFIRYRNRQTEILLHPNPANRILHTEMIGEMNGYLHAMLVRRPGYSDVHSVLRGERVYMPWVSPRN